MLLSFSRSKPRFRTVSMQTSTARSFVELDARGQDRVLEHVLALGELGGNEARLAGLAQPVEALALVRVGGIVLGAAERVDLVAREEIAVARDDLRALGNLLLPHAHGA